MLAKAGPSGEPIATPSVCLYMMSLKLNSTPDGSSMKTSMKSATSGVEFSFNDIMYKQTDGVAMGSPLGPALANIFVGFYEEKLFSQKSKPSTYFRYVDDTFAMFRNEEESDNFFKQLNCLHPSLKFTFEKEKNIGALL